MLIYISKYSLGVLRTSLGGNKPKGTLLTHEEYNLADIHVNDWLYIINTRAADN